MQVQEADLVVVGSGAAGLTAAIAAQQKGLRVVVLEKDTVVGGTTAISGGVLWIPLTAHGRRQNPDDSPAAVREYLRHETGAFYSDDEVELLIEKGPEMVEFFEQHTALKFSSTLYPDYHPDAPGGCEVGRAVVAAPFDIRRLGPERKRLRPPLRTITFMGMMFNSSNADLKHFFRATRSLTSLAYVVRRLASHLWELARYGQAVHVTGGNALAAALFKVAALDLQIPILTSTTVTDLVTEDGEVVGVQGTASQGQPFHLSASAGVVLACGGFSHERSRTAPWFRRPKGGQALLSATPDSITGDGIRLGISAGGCLADPLPQPAAWMPLSLVPMPRGEKTVFPHLLDRYKPGVIAVLDTGQRFTNESNSYHDVCMAALAHSAGETQAAMWLICDKQAFDRYGLGYAKPAPLPYGHHLRSGYLHTADHLVDLGKRLGIDGEALARTVAEFNVGARQGEDLQFGRGSTAFNRFLGDPDRKPNPCVAPIEKPPFFGLKLQVGDLSTFDGLRADATGNVLRPDGSAVRGLYVVGADRVSMMGGAYPGPGINHGPHMAMAYATAHAIALKEKQRDLPPPQVLTPDAVGGDPPPTFLRMSHPTRISSRSIRRSFSALIMGATLLLAACGGSSQTQTTSAYQPTSPLATYSVAGRVSGLTGAGLSLSLNGGPAMAIAGDGSFVFPAEASERFFVTVASSAAGQTCTVSNATGASAETDIDNIRVNCSSTAYAVRGAVSGLAAGQQLTLTNNGADPVVASANGAYAFPVGVARNGGYAVAVSAQPAGQTCTVSNATGAGVMADTTNVDVLCANTSHRVGGAVAGLAAGATVTLLNNGSDATVVRANGTYVFATGVADQGSHAVTVGTQPSGQTCTVSNARGHNIASDVSNVIVTCDAIAYTVGGTLSGLLANQQVTLFNNGADPLTLTANGAFTFDTPIAAQSAYTVSQGAATSGLSCNLSNQSGSNVTANVTNVGLSCSTPAESIVYIPDYGNARVLGYRIDRNTGARTDLPGSPYAAGTNNRWIAINPAQTFLYTTNMGANTVSAYTIDATTGALTAVAGSPFATGATPSSIEVSPDGRFAFVANANGGNVSGYSIDQTTGALTPLPGSPYAAGIIPTKIAITADSGFLYVTNQNGNNVSAYSIDASTGALAPLSGSPYTVAQQPYGIALHPSGDFLYVPSYQGRLNVFRIDTATGALTDLMPGGYASIGSDWGLQAFATNAAGTVGYLATNQGARTYDIDPVSGALTVRPALEITGVITFVTTNSARTRLYASDFIAINMYIAEIDASNGNLSPIPGSPISVGARPYNLVVIER